MDHDQRSSYVYQGTSNHEKQDVRRVKWNKIAWNINGEGVEYDVMVMVTSERLAKCALKKQFFRNNL